ncbi:MAG: hypothetical protein WD995_05725, partial [Gemmatimonadota bacterium]
MAGFGSGKIHLLCRAVHLQQPSATEHHSTGIDRLGDEVVDSRIDRSLLLSGADQAGDHDDRKRGMLLGRSDRPRDLEAVDQRHVPIENH